jgi:hypothetical protein
MLTSFALNIFVVIYLKTGFVKQWQVLRRWWYRWNRSAKHTPLGYQQVSKCLELADRCTQVDPKGRPDISNIIDELNLIDSMEDQFQVSLIYAR